MNDERDWMRKAGQNFRSVDWFEPLAWLAVLAFCVLFWAGLLMFLY